MTTEMNKLIFMGIDLTSRKKLWAYAGRLKVELAERDNLLFDKERECVRLRARIDRLERMAGAFASERNEADSRIRELEAQLAAQLEAQAALRLVAKPKSVSEAAPKSASKAGSKPRKVKPVTASSHGVTAE